MTSPIAFLLLVLLCVGWSIAVEYTVALVFDLIDYWRTYVKRK